MFNTSYMVILEFFTDNFGIFTWTIYCCRTDRPLKDWKIYINVTIIGSMNALWNASAQTNWENSYITDKTISKTNSSNFGYDMEHHMKDEWGKYHSSSFLKTTFFQKFYLLILKINNHEVFNTNKFSFSNLIWSVFIVVRNTRVLFSGEKHSWINRVHSK